MGISLSANKDLQNDVESCTPPGMTREHIRHAITDFQQFSSDDGYVDRANFTKVLSERKIMVNEHVIDRLFSVFDKDDNGKIDVREWLSVALLYVKGCKEAKLSLQFQIFDLDGDGFLSRDEVQTVLKYTTPGRLTEIMQDFDKLDANADGKLSHDEFMKAMEPVEEYEVQLGAVMTIWERELAQKGRHQFLRESSGGSLYAKAAPTKDWPGCVRLFITGPAGVGKTALVRGFAGMKEEEDDRERYVERGVNGIVNEYRVRTKVTIAPSEKEASTVRGLLLKGIDVAVCCFSVTSEQSLNEVKELYFPEIKQHAPNAVVVLLGTGTDKRLISKKEDGKISFCEGVNIAESLDMWGYVECQASSMQSADAAMSKIIKLHINRSKE